LRTLSLSLFVGTVVLFGALQAATDLAGRNTLRLDSDASVVFLGITGDYHAMSSEAMATMLTEAHELTLVGDSLRADTNDEHRVWAVRLDKETGTSSKVAKQLDRALKKIDFRVEELRATVLAPGSGESGRDVRSALRSLERGEEKVHAVWMDRRANTVWVFHESKLKSRRIADMLRDTEVDFDFHHQEFDLLPGGEAKASADLDKLNGCAIEKLDLVRATRRDDALVLDLFLRDVSSFQLLKEGPRVYLCPTLGSTLLAEGPVGVEWSVTLTNDGFPFVGR